MKPVLAQNKCVIVGATGVVGNTMMQILAERKFPAKNLSLVASQRSAGRKLPYNGQLLEVQALPTFDFSGQDLALFSAGAEISRKYAPKAENSGCYVIDNTSCFRYEQEIALVIPEINPEAITSYRSRKIIANPNCSTIGILMAVKPIHDAVGVLTMQVATYQSVSGAGASALKELNDQSARLLQGQSAIDDALLDSQPKQIAFNVLPHIDQFQDNGFTKEEMKVLWETQKILDPAIEVNPTCVRVPVLFGHSAAVHLEIKKPLDYLQAKSLLQGAQGIKVLDDREEKIYPTAATEAAGSDLVYVGRIRSGLLTRPGLNFWVVSDNLRKGAATNSIQIAELLVASMAEQALAI